MSLEARALLQTRRRARSSAAPNFVQTLISEGVDINFGLFDRIPLGRREATPNDFLPATFHEKPSVDVEALAGAVAVRLGERLCATQAAQAVALVDALAERVSEPVKAALSEVRRAALWLAVSHKPYVTTYEAAIYCGYVCPAQAPFFRGRDGGRILRA